MSVNESFYDKKLGATQTDPDFALRHMETWKKLENMSSIAIKYTMPKVDDEAPTGPTEPIVLPLV